MSLSHSFRYICHFHLGYLALVWTLRRGMRNFYHACALIMSLIGRSRSARFPFRPTSPLQESCDQVAVALTRQWYSDRRCSSRRLLAALEEQLERERPSLDVIELLARTKRRGRSDFTASTRCSGLQYYCRVQYNKLQYRIITYYYLFGMFRACCFGALMFSLLDMDNRNNNVNQCLQLPL